jgi:hypothetical protein
VILPPLGACTVWYAIVLRLKQEINEPGNYLKQFLTQNETRRNDLLGRPRASEESAPRRQPELGRPSVTGKAVAHWLQSGGAML